MTLDEETKNRMDGHKAKKAELQARIQNYQLSPQAAVDSISDKDVEFWCEMLREKLLDTQSGFSKDFLQLLVREIVLTKNEVKVFGNPLALAGAIKFRT